MPFVHIIMEPRDEESKHRIAREVADAMAEGTNNSIDGIQTIFHEVSRPGYAKGLSLASRRARRTEAPARADFVSVVRLKIGDEAAYLAFRRDHANPAMARQTGFVSTMLLRLAGGEYLLLNKWMTKADSQAWAETAEHKKIEKLATESGFERLERSDANLVHQLFGATGGKVMDSAEARSEMTPATV
jgi:heme-degrading monooxygenase HmoA/phenylpyruvate tautomerase PptA (4-oxalocrotonate tautomerase family)